TIQIWNLKTGKVKFTFDGHSSWVSAIALMSVGKTVISGLLDNTVKIWNLETREEIATFTVQVRILSCAVAPDGLTVVAGEASGTLHFLRLQERGSGRINVIT
ncbi:MAG: WD40 repeat domain-containing protein, partial [Dolichospermum sp.]